MLVLEIELLTGAYRAAQPSTGAAEWPPHPERVFSALAQAWADGGCDIEERAALEWLERQPAPCIEADEPGDVGERDRARVYVPPNDISGGDIHVLPERRRRQARTFTAAVPANPLVRYGWRTDQPSEKELAGLKALAARVASIGHSASLVRCAVVSEDIEANGRLWLRGDTGRPLRVPHPGRLNRLERWHRNGQRPLPGPTARYSLERDRGSSQPVRSTFGGADQWFVFEDAGGFRPDLLATAQVAKRVRDALMSLSPEPVPELISGHSAAGGATTNPHIAVLPLANVGWEHSSGDLLGFAIVLPRIVDASERARALQAIAKFARVENEAARAELHFGSAGSWQLQYSASPSRSSLKPERWCALARTWASATPVILDRFPEHGDAVEEARIIAAACRNIGLPEPVAIELHKHSAVEGAFSAYLRRGHGAKPDWSFPRGSRFGHRPRRHVLLHFDQPVEGPVVLGAGRFHGLGLCLPIDVRDLR